MDIGYPTSQFCIVPGQSDSQSIEHTGLYFSSYLVLFVLLAYDGASIFHGPREIGAWRSPVVVLLSDQRW
jgi:hypothetical protein